MLIGGRNPDDRPEDSTPLVADWRTMEQAYMMPHDILLCKLLCFSQKHACAVLRLYFMARTLSYKRSKCMLHSMQTHQLF